MKLERRLEWILFFISIVMVMPVQGQNLNRVDSLLGILELAQEDSAKVNLLIHLSEAYANDDLKLALKYAQEALVLAEKIDDTEILAKSLNYSGKLSLQAGLLDIATVNLTRYLDLMEAAGDRLEIAYTLNNLGAICVYAGEQEKAIGLFEKSRNFLTTYYADKNEALPVDIKLNFYGNIGGCYLEKGDYGRASEQIMAGIKLGRANPQFEAELAILLANYGELLSLTKVYAEAETVLLEVFGIYSKLRDRPKQAAILQLLADMYDRQGDKENAFIMYQEGYTIALNAGIPNRIHNFAQSLSRLYKESGKPDSAYKYLTIAVENEKRMNAAKANEEMTRYELTSQFREQDKVNQTLSIALRRRTIILVLTGLAATAVIIFLSLFIRKRNRKAREEIMLAEQLLKELKESTATKDKLYSIISPDLKGSLGASVPALEILTSNRLHDENARNELLGELAKASKSAYNLLENLLAWTRLQSDTIKIVPVRVNMEQAVHENAEPYRVAFGQKHIAVNIDVDPLLEAYADKHALDIIIRNLLSNAVKFTPENGMVNISGRKTGDYIEVTIANTGKGIEKEVLEALFKSNANASTQGTHGEPGTGLGLVLCRDFVERNGGSIRASSIPGEGSRFIFTLPAAAKA